MNPKELPKQTGPFFIDGPAGRLEATITLPSGEQPPLAIGVICHPHPLHGGTMENKVVTTVARAFKELGVAAIRFNFRGVGASEGQYGEGVGELADLRAVLDWLSSVQPTQRIWLAGFSFGAYISLQAAEHSQVTQLISIAPPVHDFDFTHLPSFQCPWLIIQGDKDEVVPHDQLCAWEKELTRPHVLRVMRDASHFFHGRLVELRAILIQALAPQAA
jgi:alpha/beta superfamily hydrolase